jgi:recombinational DNA repair ATPase RecF
VIKIESITIGEVRGIKDLTLNLGEKSFVITGPNGTGKSGVIDSIDFCLTGEIARLKGEGTANVSTKQHGPHVEHRDSPEAAEVQMVVRLAGLNLRVKLTRNMERPNVLKVELDSPAIRAALAEISSHPELVLSRREITRYVLARSNDLAARVQELLRLGRIEDIRTALTSAKNKINDAADAARSAIQTAVTSLRSHVGADESGSPDVLTAVLVAVNERRTTLALPKLASLDDKTRVDVGFDPSTRDAGFNKESALHDLEKLKSSVEGVNEQVAEERARIMSDIATVERDTTVTQLLQQRSLVADGLKLLQSRSCPLCDTVWPDIESLREHLTHKLATSEEANQLKSRVLNDAKAISAAARALAGVAAQVATTAKTESESDLSNRIEAWRDDLEEFAKTLTDLDGVVAAKTRISSGWANIPVSLSELIARYERELSEKPDQSATDAARTFLTLAQERLELYRSKVKRSELADRSTAAANLVHETYGRIVTETLTSIYEEVEVDFASFYRELNSDDEASFEAKLTPSAGRLELTVDFHGAGMYPPRAYHSEGHQDGMGVCLYLALMRRLLGDRFQLAVLDDVVMSIDGGHRREFCRLLREHFPDTQFIITTHDPIWASQLRSEHIVDSKTTVEFQGWSVETGPIFEPVSEVWDRIAADLVRNDVPAAAGRLRRHLEYISRELADETAALIPYRGDARYDPSELLGAVFGRYRDLLGMAAASADSWNNDEAKKSVDAIKQARKDAVAGYSDEQWAVNPAVHYNEWATFSKEDFEPVVAVMKTLVEQFQCSSCGSWIYPSPKNRPESLRCQCAATNLNLLRKPAALPAS